MKQLLEIASDHNSGIFNSFHVFRSLQAIQAEGKRSTYPEGRVDLNLQGVPDVTSLLIFQLLISGIPVLNASAL